MISGSWVNGALDAATGVSPGDTSEWFESARGDHGVICSHTEDWDVVLAAAHVDPRALPDTDGCGYAAAWVDRGGSLFLARDDIGRVPQDNSLRRAPIKGYGATTAQVRRRALSLRLHANYETAWASDGFSSAAGRR